MAASQASVLIHYLGDETITVNFSHGNCKDNNHRVFHRSRPSVLADLSSIKIFLQIFTKVPLQSHQRSVPLFSNQ